MLGAVRRNPWLRAFHQRLRAAGKAAILAPIAAMRKLLDAVPGVVGNRKPFAALADMARAAEAPHADAARAMPDPAKRMLNVTASHGSARPIGRKSTSIAISRKPAASGRPTAARVMPRPHDPDPSGSSRPREATWLTHLRRDFHDAWHKTKSAIVREALDGIGALCGRGGEVIRSAR